MTEHHVTDAETDAILEYASDVVKTLGLPTWVLLIMQDPPEGGDAHAAVKWIDGRYVAQIYLNVDWLDLPDDTRRNTITHEVLHLVHARLSDAVDDVQPYIHDHEFRPWQTRVIRETELMVDHFATFMSDAFRLTDAWTQCHVNALVKHGMTRKSAEVGYAEWLAGRMTTARARRVAELLARGKTAAADGTRA